MTTDGGPERAPEEATEAGAEAGAGRRDGGPGAHLVRWSDRPAEPGANGVARRRLEGEGVALVRIELPAGAVADEHAHAHEQFVEVLAGAGTLTTADGTREFGAGDLFRFPPGTPHSATFSADTVLLEINVSARG